MVGGGGGGVRWESVPWRREVETVGDLKGRDGLGGLGLGGGFGEFFCLAIWVDGCHFWVKGVVLMMINEVLFLACQGNLRIGDGRLRLVLGGG